jgi:uncharacterized membrane protein
MNQRSRTAMTGTRPWRGGHGSVRMLARSALVGAATGSRSCTGLAALALSAPAGLAQPDRALGVGWVKGLATVAAAQELVIDKLPGTPGRLSPAGLGARVVIGTAAGTIVARRQWPRPAGGPGPADSAEADGSTNPGPVQAGSAGAAGTAGAVAAAAAMAVAAAWLGAHWRQAATRHFGHDYPGAVIEDVAAMSLAWVAVLS